MRNGVSSAHGGARIQDSPRIPMRLFNSFASYPLALLLIAPLLLMRVPEAADQTPGDCDPAEAEAHLDVANVRAVVFNNGMLFRSVRGEYGYVVPKDEDVSPLYSTSIWVGGVVDRRRRLAASIHTDAYWPGPLDAAGNPPVDCSVYDRIFEITREELTAFNGTGEPPPGIRDWPAHLGAPVLDGDGVEGNYNIEGGDRPALVGDQLLWWIMNDAGNEQPLGSLPLGLEVRGEAFAYKAAGGIGNTTFYRYTFTYRGATPADSVYVGMFVDGDLGDFSDDYVGSDSTLDLGFTYNAIENDGVYGSPSPAIGHVWLQTPDGEHDERDNDGDGEVDEPGEMLGMTSFVPVDKNGSFAPETMDGYYNALKGLWPTGAPMTIGGDGKWFSPGSWASWPTTFGYPADPPNFWSMDNLDGAGTPLTPSDKRFVSSSGPFVLEPGDEFQIAFAIVWSRGEDRLDSVRKLKSEAAHVRSFADAFLVPAPVAPALPPTSRIQPLGYSRNVPNPFSSATTITFGVPVRALVTLRIYDVLGRHVSTLLDEPLGSGLHSVEFRGDHLPPVSTSTICRSEIIGQPRSWCYLGDVQIVRPSC